MYDRHKPIIKWYEYDARKLYQTAESEDVTQEAAEQTSVEQAPSVNSETDNSFTDASEDTGSSGSLTGSELDDEVARIMAAFSGAKQNGVDDVFAKMAAEEEAAGSAGDSGETESDAEGAAQEGGSEEDLLASILAPKQNSVDDLVAKAREG